MRAFVIRGFGVKAGVDFDRVHEELIGPALETVGLEGGTTGLIVEAGNIRDDVIHELVMADLVVADVSIHNANVFYELGVRHAARNRATVLIRARIDEVPFDLRVSGTCPTTRPAPPRRSRGWCRCSGRRWRASASTARCSHTCLVWPRATVPLSSRSPATSPRTSGKHARRSGPVTSG